MSRCIDCRTDSLQDRDSKQLGNNANFNVVHLPLELSRSTWCAECIDETVITDGSLDVVLCAELGTDCNGGCWEDTG